MCYDIYRVEGVTMQSRMDKYHNNEKIPQRSEKNQELYRQIYNAYDEFENLVVPSNARVIDKDDLKKEIAKRSDYKVDRENYSSKTQEQSLNDDEKKTDNQIYDINELLTKAVSEVKKDNEEKSSITSRDYLKKLKLDNSATDLESFKASYKENVIEPSSEDIETESLLKTANLSLEILSDLKGDNDNTSVSPPIKDEFLNNEDLDFYSSKYKFSNKDFVSSEEKEDDDFFNDELKPSSPLKTILKVFLIILGISIVVIVSIYLYYYFKRG